MSNWKLCGDFGKKVHLKTKGADKTLCGKPQENYDTAEGMYSLDQAKKLHGSDMCNKCINKAELTSLNK